MSTCHQGLLRSTCRDRSRFQFGRILMPFSMDVLQHRTLWECRSVSMPALGHRPVPWSRRWGPAARPFPGLAQARGMVLPKVNGAATAVSHAHHMRTRSQHRSSTRKARRSDLYEDDRRKRNIKARHLPVKQLDSENQITEDVFFKEILSGCFKNIVVLTGAGISTSAGIPDFRSKGGLFDCIRKRFGKRFPCCRDRPEHFFSRHFEEKNPETWKHEILPWLQKFKFCCAPPTLTHWFCSWLYNRGWLTTVYTQNVDGLHLHQDLQMRRDLIVECHGSLADGSCVLYGDKLPERFDECCSRDFPNFGPKVDLIMVFGTSLQVAPFCGIPNMALKGCTRVLVNRNLSDCMTNQWNPPCVLGSSAQIGEKEKGSSQGYV